MKFTYFTIVALSFTLFLGCSNSDSKEDDFANTQQDQRADDRPKRKSSQLDTTDSKLLVDAVLSNKMAVELGNKMIYAGSNPELLAFAKKLTEDHIKHHKSLENLAAKKGVELPKTLPLPQTQVIKQLENLKPNGKNEYFIKALVADYEKIIDVYAKAALSKDVDLAAFAELSKPKLNEHYTEMKKLEKKIFDLKAGQGNEPL